MPFVCPAVGGEPGCATRRRSCSHGRLRGSVCSCLLCRSLISDERRPELIDDLRLSLPRSVEKELPPDVWRSTDPRNEGPAVHIICTVRHLNLNLVDDVRRKSQPCAISRSESQNQSKSRRPQPAPRSRPPPPFPPLSTASHRHFRAGHTGDQGAARTC
jgi:hypothetical protein